MSHDHHHKKQSFGPYVALIIVAIVLIAIVNVGMIYSSSKNDETRDHTLIANQQQLITSLANSSIVSGKILNETTNHITVNTLFHGQVLYQLMNQSKILQNNTKKIDYLTAAFNEMIQAIQNAKPMITNNTVVHNNNNKPTVIHNTYCTIYVEKPTCHSKPAKH